MANLAPMSEQSQASSAENINNLNPTLLDFIANPSSLSNNTSVSRNNINLIQPSFVDQKCIASPRPTALQNPPKTLGFPS